MFYHFVTKILIKKSQSNLTPIITQYMQIDNAVPDEKVALLFITVTEKNLTELQAISELL